LTDIGDTVIGIESLAICQSLPLEGKEI